MQQILAISDDLLPRFHFNIKTIDQGVGIFIIKIRWFIMKIPIPIRQQLNSSLLDKMTGTCTDDILKHIFLNENIRISIQFSLKFVPYGPIDNIPALV